MKKAIILILIAYSCSPVPIESIRNNYQNKMNMFALINEYKEYEKACIINPIRYTHYYMDKNYSIVTIESYDSIPNKYPKVKYLSTFYNYNCDTITMNGFMKYLESVYLK